MAMLPRKQMTDEIADKLGNAIGHCLERIGKHKYLESVVSLSTHTAETQDALTLANHINTQHAHCLAMQLVKQLEAFSSEPIPGVDGRTYRAQVVVIPEDDLNFLQTFLLELLEIIKQSKSVSSQLDALTLKMQEQMVQPLFDVANQRLVFPQNPIAKGGAVGSGPMRPSEPWDRAVEALSRIDILNMEISRVEDMYRRYMNMHPDDDLQARDLQAIAEALEKAKRRKAEEKR